MSQIDLSPDQRAAVDRVLAWARAPGGRDLTFGGYAGTGKAQPMRATVWTPLGPKTMGRIRLGERVSNPEAPYARVIGIFPQGLRRVYRVTTVDGQSTLATGDHLWKYRIARSATDWRLGTTDMLLDLIKAGHAPLLPFPSAIVFARPPHALPIDPYVLGVLIGDGCLRSTVRLSSADQDLIDAVSQRIPVGHKIHRVGNSKYDYAIVGQKGVENLITAALRTLGLMGKLSHEKFVPESYKLLPVRARLDLLRGLMDTDGSADEIRGGVEFSSSSEQLARDVQWLIRSLGGKATLTPRKTTYTYRGRRREGLTSHRLYIAHPDPGSLFLLRRKVERCRSAYNGGEKPMGNRVASIEFAGEEDCQCIQVDHPNGLYLTDDFIVTHNTTLLKHVTELLPHARVMAPTGRAAQVLRRKGVNARTIHSVIYNYGGTFVDEEGEEFIAWKDKADVELPPIWVVDEASMVATSVCEDVRAKGVPVLWVGDHGQLAPVGGDPGLMRDPDVRLERVHRQAEGSAILGIAHAARLGRPPAVGVSGADGEVSVARADSLPRLVDRWMRDGVEQVACAYNNTRSSINRYWRARLGREAAVAPGERLICLFNDRIRGVYNGTILHVSEVLGASERGWRCNVVDDGGAALTLDLWSGALGGAAWRTEDKPKDHVAVDYAYAVTVHKAQGGQWQRFAVLDQECRGWDAARWRYTAYTRASERLWVDVQ